jgi:hypothetical protein
MPFYIVKDFEGPFATEREAAAFIESQEGACILLRGEQIKFAVETIRRVTIDTGTLPLFPAAPAVEDGPARCPPAEATPGGRPSPNPRVGKYGGKSVPEQVREFLIAHAPTAYTGADIAADLALPRNNVNNAIAVLRKRGVVTGNGHVSAVVP